MKTTEYFKNKVLKKRPYLKMEWIEQVMQEPLETEYQEENNRIKIWGYVKEIDKFLRIVLLSDGETVHNAFPDRDFHYTGGKNED